jgi:hypothetical protein
MVAWTTPDESLRRLLGASANAMPWRLAKSAVADDCELAEQPQRNRVRLQWLVEVVQAVPRVQRA